MAPLVSIVMPVYNAADVLRNTLACLEAQTLADFEVLCVDDGSTDASAEVVRSLAQRDGRFCLLSQQNAGAASARNAGMRRACGTYLMFLDADDTFEPTMLAALVEAIAAGDADVCVCEVDSLDHGTGRVAPRYRLPKDVRQTAYAREELEGRLFQIIHNSTWNKLYRRSFVEKTGLAFQDLPSSNDAFFVQASVAYARRIAFVKRSLVVYRINRAGSIQEGRFKNPHCPLAAAERLYDTVVAEQVLSAAGERSLANRCWQQAIEAISAAVGANVDVEKTLAEARRLSEAWGLFAWGPRDFATWDAAFMFWSFMRARPEDLVWAYEAAGTNRDRRSVAHKARVALRLAAAGARLPRL